MGGGIRPAHTSPRDQKRASVMHVARGIVASDGLLGLWRGSTTSLLRSVPGIAMYMTGLSRVRLGMANSPYFATVRATSPSENSSTLPRLSTTGNLIAGATTRVGIGFLLNPFSVLKARYEVRFLNSPGQFTLTITSTEQHVCVLVSLICDRIPLPGWPP